MNNKFAQQVFEETGDTLESVNRIVKQLAIGHREAGDMLKPFTTTQRPIYSTRSGKLSGYQLANRRVSSTQTFCVALDVLETFDSPHDCFMFFWKAYRANLLPRSGSQPSGMFSRFALSLIQQNLALGERYWRWMSFQGGNTRELTGYDHVMGYGFETEEGYELVDSEGVWCSIKGEI